MSQSEEKTSEHQGFLGSITRLIDQVVHFLITKLELFQIEVEEEWRRIATMLVLLVGAAVLAHMALIALTLTLVAFFWDDRKIVLVSITVFYVIGAAILGAVLKNKLAHTRTKLFSTTLSELRKDREWDPRACQEKLV